MHLQDLATRFPQLRVSLEALAQGRLRRIVVASERGQQVFSAGGANGRAAQRQDENLCRLRLLAARLTSVELRERRRLANLVHDDLQQFLVGARLKLGMVRHRVADRETNELLEQVDELLRTSIDSSRSLCTELSPPILYEAGLAAALEWLARQYREKHGFNVMLELQADAEPRDDNMKAALFQAVRELLSNVVQHAGVRDACVRICRLDDALVQIAVSDAGVGFERDRPREAESQGRLGLFGLRERLSVLGIETEIRSQPGAGTHVILRVPVEEHAAVSGVAAPPRPDQPSVAPTHRTPGASIRILLADDHKIVREGLTGILSDEPDMRVVGEAADGAEAVELAHRLDPDVVIMDVTMPGVSGIEATRRIAAALPHVRIIGLSAHEEEDMATALIRAGASAFLSKGGPSHDLIAIIRSCCGKTARPPMQTAVPRPGNA